MNSTNDKPTLLVANLDMIRRHGNSPREYIEVMQITLLAANESGQIFEQLAISADIGGWTGPGFIESEDIPRDMLTFVNKNFGKNRVPGVVAARMDELSLFILQDDRLQSRLQDSLSFSVDELVRNLPANSLYCGDFESGRLEQGRTVIDTFSIFLSKDVIKASLAGLVH